MCVVEVLFIVDTADISTEREELCITHWSVVSLNWISVPSGAILVSQGTKIGPRGASKSVIFGGGNLYLMGAGALDFRLCLFDMLDFGSGVALALVSGARDPAFDSRFLRDSFFVLGTLSRATAISSTFEDLKSGLRGDDMAGW